MELTTTKIPSSVDPDVFLRVTKGHFATNHSHINAYIDMTTLKARKREAQGAAKILAEHFTHSTVVDTIICLDGTQVIGAFLADELQRAGITSINQHQTIYVLSPETDSSGQAILRDNTKFMVEGKHVLILLGTATTGITLERSMQFVEYYGGELTGIACLFSAITKAAGMPIVSLFGPKDLPEYRSYALNQCPMCRERKRLDGIVNMFGYNRL